MNLIKIFFIIIINLFVIVFMTQNSTDRITVQFFSWGIQDAYLNVVLLFTMIFGIIAGFLSAAIIIFYHKSEIKILTGSNPFRKGLYRKNFMNRRLFCSNILFW